MGDSSNIVVRVEQDNYRNAIIRVSLVSDGSGLSNFVLVDPTAAVAGAVNLSVAQAGQVFYPGVHLKILKAFYDVQDMKVRLLWKGTSNEDALVFGNAPQDFDYGYFGGLRVPAGIAGATGQLLLTTIGQVAGSTFSLLLHLRKNIAGAGVVSGMSIGGTPPAATIGVPYSFTPSVSGGTAPFTFSLIAGSLPTNLSLNTSTGAITGTPSGAPGTSAFTLRVTDANSNAANLPTSITVSAAGGGSPSLDFSQSSNSMYVALFAA